MRERRSRERSTFVRELSTWDGPWDEGLLKVYPYLKEELEEHYATRKLDFPPKKNIALEIKFAQPHSLVTSPSA